MHDEVTLPNIQTQSYSPYEPFLYGMLKAFDSVLDEIRSHDLTLMLGKSGYGKTTHAVYSSYHTANSILISACAGTNPANLTKAICAHFRIPTPPVGKSNQERVDHMIGHLSGDPVIIIDDADQMPIESLALLSLLASCSPESNVHIVMVGLPTLEKRLSSVCYQDVNKLSIEPMSKEDIRYWVKDVLNHSNMSFLAHKISDSFYENLHQHSQGVPKQIHRFTEPMLKTEIMSIGKSRETKRKLSAFRRSFNIAASVSLVSFAGMMSQSTLMAQIKTTSLFNSKENKTVENSTKNISSIAKIHAKVEEDERYVIQSKSDFIQVGATQQLPELISWLSSNAGDKDNLRIVRAIKSNQPYYIALVGEGGVIPPFSKASWIRKYDSIVQDIDEFSNLTSHPSVTKA